MCYTNKTNKAWIALAEVKGAEPINLPSNFNELNIRCYYKDGLYQYGVDFSIIRESMNYGNIYYGKTYNANGESYGARIAVDSSRVQTVNSYNTSGSVLDITSTTVWYR